MSPPQEPFLSQLKRRITDMRGVNTLYRVYRKQRVARLAASFKNRQVQHMYGLHSLTVELRDGLAEAWYDHDWSDPPEFRLLRQAGLKPGALVFDCGAHHAVVAVMLAREVAPGGSVVAVEAEPRNVSAARANVALNAAAVTVVHAALAADEGHISFAEGLNGHAEKQTRAGMISVPATTLDALSCTYGVPAVVYLDIEGFEYEALRGAERLVEDHHPSLLIEVHAGAGLEAHGGVTAEEVWSRLEQAGYDLHAAPVDIAGRPQVYGRARSNPDILTMRHHLVATYALS
jgi:FkbM family methyltransferase